MRKLLKTATAMAMGLGVLAGAKAASAASTHGVVFIHGTGDSPGAMTCTGQNCTVPAAYGSNGYWYPGEVASIANGRPYAVVGFNGGSCAPWPQSGDATYNKTGTASSCPLPSTTGNADVIVGQIVQFLNTGITDIAIVTHSGGSNQARYIMNNYTRNANYTKVKNATKRVVTVAGTTKGTYLANVVFSGGIGGYVTGALAGFAGYGGEGVNILRTNLISTYNSDSSYLGAIRNPINGVNFYGTGGTATTIGCVGAKIFGVCIGISNVRSLDGDATPLTACDSVVEDTALLFLHDNFLDANDSSTARSPNCSDGFISCQSSQALGNNFAFGARQDHNQSRRQCNSLDVAIRNVVSGSEANFDLNLDSSSSVDPHQLDACGFGVYASVKNSSGTTVAWTEGCTKSQLGNGNCDWDCVALYGNDAVVTSWDASGKKPLTWGASDCVGSQPTGTTGLASSTVPFNESGTYTNASGTFNTAFNGYTCTGDAAHCGGNNPASYQWFYDPNYNATGALSALSAGYCPQSWVGDGTCDECVLALYGSDGNDCLPGRIVQCGGIVTQSQPYQGSSYYYYNNPIYNEGLPSSGGSSWLEWQSMSAVAGNGVCENTECTKGVGGAQQIAASCASSSDCPGSLSCSGGVCTACSTNADCNGYGSFAAGTCVNSKCWITSTITSSQCTTNADCLTGTCVNNGCTTNAADCSATVAIKARTCATNTDCNGNVCQGGTCAVTGEACTSDSSCAAVTGGSTCSAGVCSCSTSLDCPGGAACTAGACAASATISLCR